jgi:hypothetical protein
MLFSSASVLFVIRAAGTTLGSIARTKKFTFTFCDAAKVE